MRPVQPENILKSESKIDFKFEGLRSVLWDKVYRSVMYNEICYVSSNTTNPTHSTLRNSILLAINMRARTKYDFEY